MMADKFARRLLSNLIVLIIVVLLGGFAAAALVRYSPGFDSIPEDLNPQIGPDTLRALHERHRRDNALPVFYARYLSRALRGDFGDSEALRQPVADLLRQRVPVTARLIAWGTAGGWLLAGLLAWLAVWPRQRALLGAAASGVSGLLLAIPPAVLALAFFFSQAPLELALALALLPRLYGTLRVVLEDLFSSPALLAARSRGVASGVIGLRYALGAAAPRLAALLGIGLVLAFGAAIPIEALCGVPGVGALALQAATSRDMPLLCGLALAITFFVTLVHAAGDLAVGRAGESPA
jgi:peptide/nickel transport system permease protein